MMRLTLKTFVLLLCCSHLQLAAQVQYTKEVADVTEWVCPIERPRWTTSWKSACWNSYGRDTVVRTSSASDATIRPTTSVLRCPMRATDTPPYSPSRKRVSNLTPT